MIADLDHIFSHPQGFLVIDGVNGAGKSTVIHSLQSRLERNGFSLTLTREPGGTELGQTLRSLLLASEEKLTPLTELFLFSADRAHHVEKVIRPALESRHLVLCDRYHYSTTAFQGFGRGVPVSQIEHINSIATGGLVPDAVLLLDIPVEVGLARAAARQGARDNFESETVEFHQQIRKGFLSLAAQAEEPFFLIDATQTEEQVQNACWNIVERWAEAWQKNHP